MPAAKLAKGQPGLESDAPSSYGGHSSQHDGLQSHPIRCDSSSLPSAPSLNEPLENGATPVEAHQNGAPPQQPTQNGSDHTSHRDGKPAKSQATGFSRFRQQNGQPAGGSDAVDITALPGSAKEQASTPAQPERQPSQERKNSTSRASSSQKHQGSSELVELPPSESTPENRDQTITMKPIFHVMPQTGWGSDPNGPIFWKGRYHLFFQHRPETCQWYWGLCWDHVVSEDLAHWTRMPVALAPSEDGPDADGVFSGSIEVDPHTGVPIAFYTGVRLRSNMPHPPDEDVDLGLKHVETQCCAVCDPDDEWLKTWHKVPTPWMKAPHTGQLTSWRDPWFIESGDGKGKDWVMTIGSGIKGAGGTALVYRTVDVTKGWRFDGHLASWPNMGTGICWECPFLVKLRALPLGLHPLPGQALQLPGPVTQIAEVTRTTKGMPDTLGKEPQQQNGFKQPNGYKQQGDSEGYECSAPPPDMTGGLEVDGSCGAGSEHCASSVKASDCGATCQKGITDKVSDPAEMGGGIAADEDQVLDDLPAMVRKAAALRQQKVFSGSTENAIKLINMEEAVDMDGGIVTDSHVAPATAMMRKHIKPTDEDIDGVIDAPAGSLEAIPLQTARYHKTAPVQQVDGDTAPKLADVEVVMNHSHRLEGQDHWFFCCAPDACTYSVIYWLGKCNEKRNRFHQGDSEDSLLGRPIKLDLGNVFYAPTCFRDPQGRHIVWGYMKELWNVPAPPCLCNKYSYSNCVSLPRALYIKGEKLYQVPLPELTALRTCMSVHERAVSLKPGPSHVLSGVTGLHIDMEVVMSPGTATRTVILIKTWRTAGRGAMAVVYDWQSQRLDLVYDALQHRKRWTGRFNRASRASIDGIRRSYDDLRRASSGFGSSDSLSGIPEADKDAQAALMAELEAEADMCDFDFVHDPDYIPDPDMNPDVEDWIRMKRDEAGGVLDLAPGSPLGLRILLDASCLEIFTSTGQVLTTRVYRGTPPSLRTEGDAACPPDDSLDDEDHVRGVDPGIEFFAFGGSCTLDSLDVWEMEAAWTRQEDMPGGCGVPPSQQQA